MFEFAPTPYEEDPETRYSEYCSEVYGDDGSVYRWL